MDSHKETCAICLGSMNTGQGEALFTAECSHIFHFKCISSNVQHGNHICPTCRCTWKYLPLQATSTNNHPPTPIPSPPQPPITNPLPNFNSTIPYSFRRRQPGFSLSLQFDDDEPLPSSTLNPEDETSSSSTSAPQHNGGITVKALPEYPALSKSQQSDSFSVLVGIRAPPLSPEASDSPETRAPLDLVAVLDVSGSMQGDKMRLLKQAVNFVVDNLGPMDRLSIVTFSTLAQRMTPLRRMTDAGRANMAQAVNSLRANGATNIIAGLNMAVQVLQQRRERNPVASIILLSDGQDNQNGQGSEFLNDLRQLPSCIRSRDYMDISVNQNQTEIDVVPVHTFGFGSDHDSTALHAIADGSGGTFSYIESIEIIQDAFAQCIGGLLSVVSQEVEIHLNVISPGVRIQSIRSGRYRNRVDSDSGKNGVIYVEELYAEEEKQFLIYLSIPQAMEAHTTQLLDVKCSYKDLLSNETHMSMTKTVEIRRPPTEALSEADRQVCLEVDRERNRVSVSEELAQAQAMADRGELDQAHSLLGLCRGKLLNSASAQAGDNLSKCLESEVRDIQERMTNKVAYKASGKAFMLSKRSGHMYQRATTQAVMPQMMMPQSSSRTSFARAQHQAASGSVQCAATDFSALEVMGYQTSSMKHMVKKSQELRQSNIQEDKEASGSGSLSKP